MPRIMKQGDVLDMAHAHFQSFLRSRKNAIILDAWMKGEQYQLDDILGDNRWDASNPGYGRPYQPRSEASTDEYENLSGLAVNNFAGLVVRAVQQNAYVDGIRRPKVVGNLPYWETWQRNGMDAKQNSIHACAAGLAQAFGIVLPGKDPLTGDKMSKITAKSPKEMAAFYNDDDDEWPSMALAAQHLYGDGELGKQRTGWTVQVYDAYAIHFVTCQGDGEDRARWNYLSHTTHPSPVPPVARLANRLDLDGRAMGEIEPVLPLLRRIDQDTFDRLITQRFGAWQIRYISGMAKPTTDSEKRAAALKLQQSDFLVSDNKDTKFGTIPGGPIDPFIAATDSDLRLLSAISQTPPHHLLGLSSNLQAEALAAAESGLQRKSADFRQNAGEFHEQMARLDAFIRGDMTTARAFDMQVRWRDTEPRSNSQAADALGKLAVQLKVPVEMLWEKIPGWTDIDVERAKSLIQDGTFENLVKELMERDVNAQEPANEEPTDDGNDN